MRCPGCHGRDVGGGPLAYCRHCGRVLLSRDEVVDLRAGPPPKGMEVAAAGEPSDRMSPYRSGVRDDPALEIDFDHEKRRTTPSAIVLVLALALVAPGRRDAAQMRIFLAIVGIAALVVYLIPQRTRMTMAVTGTSISFGRRGVPRSRWRVVDPRAFGQVFAVAEPTANGRNVRYGIDVLMHNGAGRTLLRNLRDGREAAWLALAIERRLGLQVSSMQALDHRGR